MVSSFASNPSPTCSVKMTSASVGSVTTWSTCPLVSRLARYWSSPCDIESMYTVRAVSRSAAHRSAPEPHRSNINRFIGLMISAARGGILSIQTRHGAEKSEAHV